MSREKRDLGLFPYEVLAVAVSSFHMSDLINSEQYQECMNSLKQIRADYTKLQEERDKAVELLREIVSVEKYIIKKVSILGAIVSLAKDFLNQLDKEKG